MEAVKVKFYCFLGIVHPTVYNTVGEPDYQSRRLTQHLLSDTKDLKNVRMIVLFLDIFLA